MDQGLICFLLAFIIAGTSTKKNPLSQINASDIFEEKRESSLKNNPSYLLGPNAGYEQDAYQPYYVCEPNDDPSGMSLSSWHYSCKESCMNNHLKQQINITGAKWNYIGPDISVYKIITNEVCYTSHENVWGYCSQAQTTRPVKTELSDKDKLPEGILGGTLIPAHGVYYITNSESAECSYFYDDTRCARDYQVISRSGKIIRRSDGDRYEMTILMDGVRTDPSTGYLELDDVSWFWKIPDTTSYQDCGWEKTNKISCSYTNTTDIITCPSIGYTYNIQGITSGSTCAGTIYDHDGPFPFFFETEKDYPDSKETYKSARQGKADPDIAFIDGVNKAFTDLELTYCSATCDLFARQGSQKEDHVLDTPIGIWRYCQEGKSDPRLIPCLPTSSWKVNEPTTLCHGKDHILVVDGDTGHPGSWDTKKDYVITGEVCNTGQDQINVDLEDMRDQIAQGKTVNITFWTGDVMRLSPPYDEPEWIDGARYFRQNPSWFSSVRLNKEMLHTREEITTLLTDMVRSAKAEVLYKKQTAKTLKSLMWDEVCGGVGSVANGLWRGLYSIFGGFAKIMIIGLSLGLVYLIVMICIKMKLLTKGQVPKKVTFLTPQEEGDVQGYTQDYSPSPSIISRRRAKMELNSLLA